MRTESIAPVAARRMALAAQQLDTPWKDAGGGLDVTARRLAACVRRMGVLQIDSVNIVARAHLLPLFARLGPYDTALVGRIAGTAPRAIVESWAHACAFQPVEHYPLLDFRRRAYEAGGGWDYINGTENAYPRVVADVAEIVAAEGPVTARGIQERFEADHPRTRENWGWNWSIAKRALERLFATGRIAVAGRNAQFERSYDVPERVLPPRALEPPPSRADAIAQLVEIAAKAQGIGSVACYADYFRLPVAETRAAVARLEDAGRLVPVDVACFPRGAWRHVDARRPRSVRACALLAPFDPVVFTRPRLEALFGLKYRIGIYTPAHKRTDGYYLLPFVLGDQMAATVDLKADRAAGALRVTGAWLLPDVDARVVVPELRAELESMAGWLGLGDVRQEMETAGNLRVV